VTGQGINCTGRQCTGTFKVGESVTLKAEPDESASFQGWAGACSGRQPICSFRLANKAPPISLTFASASFPLTVVKQGSGTVTSTPPGIKCGLTACTGSFPQGSVALTADPASGAAWTGCDQSDRGKCVVNLKSPRELSVSFARNKFRLRIDKGGEGQGTVRARDFGIDCGKTCSVELPQGAEVLLASEPDKRSTLRELTGCEVIDAQRCRVVMTEHKNVKAIFSPIADGFLLTVNVAGSGSVRSDPPGINCPKTCSYRFGKDQRVILTPIPGSAGVVAGWSGCDNIDGSHCTVTMTAVRAVSLSFVPPPIRLSISSPKDLVVASEPAGIKCPPACAADFHPSTRVTLFVHGTDAVDWQGCDPSDRPDVCSIILERAAEVTVRKASIFRFPHFDIIYFIIILSTALVAALLLALLVPRLKGRAHRDDSEQFGPTDAEVYATIRKMVRDVLFEERATFDTKVERKVREEISNIDIERSLKESLSLRELKQQIDRLQGAIGTIKDSIGDAASLPPLLSPPPTEQPSSELTDEESKMLAVVNVVWEESAAVGGPVSHQAIRSKLDSFGIAGEFYNLRDSSRHIGRMESVPYEFEVSSRSGGWLFVPARDDGLVLALPVDHSAFVGELVVVLKQFFEGWDKSPTAPRFRLAYRTCRLRATSGGSRTFQLQAKGYLTLDGEFPTPPSPMVPPSYQELLDKRRTRTTVIENRRQPAFTLIGEHLRDLHERLQATSATVDKLIRALQSVRQEAAVARDASLPGSAPRLAESLRPILTRLDRLELRLQNPFAITRPPSDSEVQGRIAKIEKSVTDLHKEIFGVLRELQAEGGGLRERSDQAPGSPPESSQPLVPVAEAEAMPEAKAIPEAEAMAVAARGESAHELLRFWLGHVPAQLVSPTGSQENRYLSTLRDCVTAVAGLAAERNIHVDVGLVHLAVGDDSASFTIQNASIETVECAACGGTPGPMTYQHFAALGNVEGDEVLIFLPLGSVLLSQRFALGYRLLLEEMPPAGAQVSALERPAILSRRRRNGGGAFTVTQKMRLSLSTTS
jgi:hypothetical protein